MNPYYQDETVSIYHGDCLQVMPEVVGANSVALVFSDPPYGITSNKWDAPFDLDAWWKQVTTAMGDEGAAVLCAGQPFTSRLVSSNYPMFKHEWIWQKNQGSNFANTIREPFKEHESVVVFASKGWTYNPQPQKRAASGVDRVRYAVSSVTKSDNYRQFEDRGPVMRAEDRCPSSVQKWNVDRGLHPTQKPLAMMRYFIETYSNPGDLVFDPFMGSGTSLRAAKDTGRRAIGIEKEERYCEVAVKRLAQGGLFEVAV